MPGMNWAPHCALPGREVEVGRVVVGVGRVVDLLDLGQAGLPVVGVRRVGDVVRAARVDLVRAGADRLRVLELHRVLRGVPGARRCASGRSGCRRRRSRSTASAGALNCIVTLLPLARDALEDRRPQGVDVEARVGLHQVERERHVVGGHRLAVVPLHARRGW